MPSPIIFPFLFLLTILIFPQTSANFFNIRDFGARPDATTDSSTALLNAWSSACASTKPSTVFVPLGRFLVRDSVLFKGPCKNSAVAVRMFGTLVAPGDYNAIGNKGNWLQFEGVDGLSIFGGPLDGQGSALWACKKGGENCPNGATTLGIYNSKNVTISGLTSLNSQMFHIVIHRCQDTKLQGVSIWAAGDSPNTDGIHVQLSSRVSILNSRISTGDDCVSVGPGTSHLWINHVACGPGHGISMGSLGKQYEEDGVENVRVENVVFKETQNGVRIKTWGRPSTGFVRGVVFQHATMINVRFPIVIDQNYCPDHKNCPGQMSGVKIRDITYEDIKGTSASEVAIKFECSEANPCEDIRMANIRLTYNNHAAQATCANAAGSVSGIIQPSSCFN